MPASKSIRADYVVTYPTFSGDAWAVLELTKVQADYLHKALAFALSSNGHSTDSVEIRDNPKVYAE